MNAKRLKALGLSALLLSLLVVLSGIYYIYYQLNRSMLHSGEQAVVQIEPNSSATTLIHSLHQQGLIKHKAMLAKYIQYKNLSTSIKAGVYQVHPGESVVQLINRIINGDVMRFMFRIVEGTDLKQVSAHLKQAPYLNYNAKDWESIKADFPSAEGLLLAETYQYDGGSSASRLLKMANKQLLKALVQHWKTRDIRLPYTTPYQLLIAASILEKETAIDGERAIISGVIVNRIKKNMPLQMDPTVIYGLGALYQGKLDHGDLLSDSPYNTYRHRGLPPTPIAMVGNASLEAAAHPVFTSYLYFVAKGDGSHVFSETYVQQQKAVKRLIEYKKVMTHEGS